MLNPNIWRRNASPMVSSWGNEVSWRSRASMRYPGSGIQMRARSLDQVTSQVARARIKMTLEERRWKT